MTVQIVENWADIEGRLLDSYPSKTADGFLTLEIKVSDVKNVKGFRNLLEDRQGEVIYVNVPESLGGTLELKPQAKITLRVRMSGSRKLFVHPEFLEIK